LKGADLSQGAGKFNNTPLMTGLMNWNVRIIDYLTERGVDPFVEDKFGFTPLKKA
jgi:ankyrin repeat protein